MAGIYVYAIVPTGKTRSFGVGGLVGGIRPDATDVDGEVYTVPYGDIAAVVSPSPLVDYQGLRRSEAVTYLVAHQRVVEAVMQEYSLLPVKFGTVLPDEKAIRRLLIQGETLFRTYLKEFADVVQMEVVVLWDLKKVFQKISESDFIAQSQVRLANCSEQEATAEKIAVGRLVAAALEERRVTLRNRVLSSLREIARDVLVNPAMGDDMVANVALLTEKDTANDGQSRLSTRLTLLDRELEGAYTFRQIGPLPPYSFATVAVQLLSFEEVDAARRCLGLGDTITTDETKKAYRALAGLLHPDHNPGDPEAEGRMSKLTQAYDLLTAYVKNHTSGKAPGPCILSRKMIEQTLLIDIRKQEGL